MKKCRFLHLLAALVIAGPSLNSKTNNPGNEDPFASLAGIVMDTDTIEYEEEEMVMDVLSFMSDVYSEHTFYESGGWAKVSPLPLSRRNNQKSVSQSSGYVPSVTFSEKNRKPTYTSAASYTPRTRDLPTFLTNDFCLPIKGRLTSRYGYRPSFGRMHKGIDVSLNIGDTIKCALPGVVTKVAYEAKGYGHYVVVSHAGGYETRYAHMTRPIVSQGQPVTPGQALGLGGSTGNSTGPHLHFEIRHNGEALDPLTCFGLSSIYR